MFNRTFICCATLKKMPQINVPIEQNDAEVKVWDILNVRISGETWRMGGPPPEKHVEKSCFSFF